MCKFWKVGNCRKGNNCNFRHSDDSGPSNNNNNNSNFGNNSNRNFGNNANNNFNNNNSNRNFNSNANNNSRNNFRGNKNNPFLLDRDAIEADLTGGEERPEWPFSSYGPGRDAPLQIIGSKWEYSPEEMRVQCYLAQAEGRRPEYEAQEKQMENAAYANFRAILENLDNEIKTIQEAGNREDNRNKQVYSRAANFPRPNARFGQVSDVAPPSGLTQFGHTSHANQNPSFPSHMGAHGNWQPQAPPSVGNTMSFGQPSAINSGSFGTASQRLQQTQSTFGQPSNVGGGGGTFGQPSSGTFGQPSNGTFGQPSNGPFGQPSNGTFGQPSNNTGTFGQPSNGNFGQPSNPPFGQTSTNSGTFGQPSNNGTFGKPSNTQTQQHQQGQAQRPNPFAPRPPLSGMPETLAQSGFDATAEGPPEAYEGQLGETLKEIYKTALQTGTFGEGPVPEIPPKREWTRA